MIQHGIAFMVAMNVYGVIIGGPITNHYFWQNWTVTASTPDNTTWANNFALPASACAYAVTAKSYDPMFDVEFISTNIQPGNGLWTFYRWTGGPWTLYVGAQVLGCGSQHSHTASIKK